MSFAVAYRFMREKLIPVQQIWIVVEFRKGCEEKCEVVSVSSRVGQCLSFAAVDNGRTVHEICLEPWRSKIYSFYACKYVITVLHCRGAINDTET